jgi:tetratricopeptide (TPR) repeat protein
VSDGKKLPVVGRGSADPLQRLLEGDSAGVIADLREQLDADPDDEIAWLQLATAYAHINHWSEAAAAYARAVDIDGSILEGRRGYARALSRLRRHDEAAFQLVQAKRLAPNDARVAHELGVAFYDKRLFDKALRELSRAKELDPQDARIRFAMGLAHEAKDAMADAIACYRDAVRLSPDVIEARRTLADALAAMGEIAQAIEELAKAQARDRTNAQIATNLDILKRSLKELEDARLLGKPIEELEKSAVVQLGQLKRKGKMVTAGEPDIIRYGAELIEVWVTLDDEARIDSLMLLLSDPERAAAQEDDTFKVTVVSDDGHHVPANLATAATLTFLREALGCPLTRASQLYAKLLETQQPVRWAGSLVSLAEIGEGDDARHGVRVAPG